MNEREYRPDEYLKAHQEEGLIAKYERYRYGSENNSYNDLGSTWSIEELINKPDDIDGTLNPFNI